jgi:hypothetical protein
MVKKNAADEKIFNIPPIKIEKFAITLVGDSPLIVHAWSEKAKKEMLDKQMKKAKTGREAKDPWLDYCNTLYWITPKPEYPTEENILNAKFGFPAVGFKSAAVDACSAVADVTKVAARGAFHIIGDLVEIVGKPTIREDMVRVGMGAADIRYRAEFREWKANVQIRHNVDALSVEQIINLFNIAGFSVGVGEWRPQKDGSYGMFHVE